MFAVRTRNATWSRIHPTAFALKALLVIPSSSARPNHVSLLKQVRNLRITDLLFFQRIFLNVSPPVHLHHVVPMPSAENKTAPGLALACRTSLATHMKGAGQSVSLTQTVHITKRAPKANAKIPVREHAVKMQIVKSLIIGPCAPAEAVLPEIHSDFAPSSSNVRPFSICNVTR